MKNSNIESAVHIPSILLPSHDTDMTKWSVVACDQYTSQPEYWTEVEQTVDTSPSTLHMVLPEIYLENINKKQRVEKINSTMEKYLKTAILKPQAPGFILVDRKTSNGKSRKGLVIAIDLEQYDFRQGSQTLIRATEKTVIDRLPPRIEIRENAIVELPHVILLIDDSEKTVIEPLFDKIHRLEKVYDFELMMNGGHIKGYKVEEKQDISSIFESLKALVNPDKFKEKYQTGSDKGVLLFAVGDGNHSLASAKVHWENLKKKLPLHEKNTHPSRYALVELLNVHDDVIEFEPIHRVIFNINPYQFIDNFISCLNNYTHTWCGLFSSKHSMQKKLHNLRNEHDDCQFLPFITQQKIGIICVENPKYNLEIGTLQSSLDQLISNDGNIKVDYIHGEDIVTSLGSKEDNMGFYLPAMDKHDLFKTIIMEGILPKKTFSMGEAEEKRFYLECRKIV